MRQAGLKDQTEVDNILERDHQVISDEDSWPKSPEDKIWQSAVEGSTAEDRVGKQLQRSWAQKRDIPLGQASSQSGFGIFFLVFNMNATHGFNGFLSLYRCSASSSAPLSTFEHHICSLNTEPIWSGCILAMDLAEISLHKKTAQAWENGTGAVCQVIQG